MWHLEGISIRPNPVLSDCFLCPGYSNEFPTINDSSIAPNTTLLSKVLQVASLLLVTCQVSENFSFSLSRIAEKKKGKPVNLSISLHPSLPPAHKNRHTHVHACTQCTHTRPDHSAAFQLFFIISVFNALNIYCASLVMLPVIAWLLPSV